MLRTNSSIREIKGVGEKAQMCFNKLGIYNVLDLFMHLPRDYDCFKPIVPISSVSEGDTVAISGTLFQKPQIKKRGHLNILSTILQDESGKINVTWFNMPFLKKQLYMGSRYIIRGKIVSKNNMLVMQQPKIYKKEEFYNLVGKMSPIYPLTAGLTNNAIKKAMEFALKNVEKIEDYLPKEIQKRQDLLSLKKALNYVHFPKNPSEQVQGRKRMVFDEFFIYQLAIMKMKKNGRIESQNIIKNNDYTPLINSLSFSLTKSQLQTCEDIIKDMTSGFVMNRLIQGDVGSGKTIVATIALYLAAKSGYQGAFMVPTEVLANQHYEGLKKLLEPLSIKVGLLIGSQSVKNKKEAKEKIENGKWDIVIGTHAIIQQGVNFKNLGLVVTDEQHRFGVRQREVLFEKGRQPHVLSMSATPIPRTLAKILYGDTDISVIDEKPADRLPIKNCVVNTSYRQTAYNFMKKEIGKGHQVYIICPMIEENEESDLENVAIYSEEIKSVFSENIKIDVLHGKMKASQKDEIMNRFSNGQIDILVSTTVIEVGIDVANATTIMIENAERFGLAQLHQLRGRVGRGKSQSYCIFMAGKETKEGMQRLNIIANSNDGFEIANKDLELRGQGDILGVRQSGDQLFKIGDIFEDNKILRNAGKEASIIAEDEALLEKLLKNNLLSYTMERSID